MLESDGIFLFFLLMCQPIFNILGCNILSLERNWRVFFNFGPPTSFFYILFLQSDKIYLMHWVKHFSQQRNWWVFNFLQRAKSLKQKKEEGNEAFRSGRLDAAYQLYTEALEIDPYNVFTNSKLFNNRATVCFKVSRLEIPRFQIYSRRWPENFWQIVILCVFSVRNYTKGQGVPSRVTAGLNMTKTVHISHRYTLFLS